MSKHGFKLSVFALASAFVALPGKSHGDEMFECFKVTVPTVALGRLENVGTFKLSVSDGVILSSNFRYDWVFKVDNTTGNSSIEGQANDGAWFLGADEWNYLKDFVTVGKFKQNDLGRTFGLSLELMIHNDENGRERSVVLRKLIMSSCKSR